MTKLVRFIYNPMSGETKIADRLDEVVSLFQQAGYSLMPYRLDFHSSPEAMIGSGEYDYLLIAGGDGTVNYVVNVIKEHGVDVPIAIIPAGTANDFAMMLGTPQGDLKEICTAILNGNPAAVDIGRVNGEYFVNVFSCGLFTDISQKTPNILKNTFGKMAYYVGGLGELTRYRKMNIRIETDGGDYEGKCLLFLVFNGKTAGTLRLAYFSEVDDGLLDVLILKGDGPFATMQTALRYLVSVQFGKPSSYPPGIVHIRCSRMTAHSSVAETTDIDGQPGPSFPLNITCEKNGLRLIRPRPLASTRRDRGRGDGE